jgi:hypothetical protein
MHELATWFAAAPSGAIPALATVVAALAALVSAILTQWVLGRRARYELLTKKLEELYILVREWIAGAKETRYTLGPLTGVSLSSI